MTLSDMSKQTDISNSPSYKQYTDSINRYLKLMTDYMTAHQSEGIKLIEDKQLVYFQNKQTEFSNKQSALVNNKQSQNNSDKIDNERATFTKQFRNASTVEIFFQFNPGVGIVHSSGGEEQVNNYDFPGAVFAKSVHILNPDTYSTPWLFDQWENMTVLLFGKWNMKTGQYNNYNATYTLNGQGDEHTPKKIMSDLIQTIAIHVMGNKTNMDKLIQQLDITKLNEATNKN